mmetsp:Transcript_18603/g.70630  ORF Transcript_18603/g.70630 Transcript_18603/m.70630 type:complete len:463 (+) Transcript_18603:285-1673(+)
MASRLPHGNHHRLRCARRRRDGAPLGVRQHPDVVSGGRLLGRGQDRLLAARGEHGRDCPVGCMHLRRLAGPLVGVATPDRRSHRRRAAARLGGGPAGPGAVREPPKAVRGGVTCVGSCAEAAGRPRGLGPRGRRPGAGWRLWPRGLCPLLCGVRGSGNVVPAGAAASRAPAAKRRIARRCVCRRFDSLNRRLQDRGHQGPPGHPVSKSRPSGGRRLAPRGALGEGCRLRLASEHALTGRWPVRAAAVGCVFVCTCSGSPGLRGRQIGSAAPSFRRKRRRIAGAGFRGASSTRALSPALIGRGQARAKALPSSCKRPARAQRWRQQRSRERPAPTRTGTRRPGRQLQAQLLQQRPARLPRLPRARVQLRTCARSQARAPAVRPQRATSPLRPRWTSLRSGRPRPARATPAARPASRQQRPPPQCTRRRGWLPLTQGQGPARAWTGRPRWPPQPRLPRLRPRTR